MNQRILLSLTKDEAELVRDALRLMSGSGNGPDAVEPVLGRLERRLARMEDSDTADISISRLFPDMHERYKAVRAYQVNCPHPDAGLTARLQEDRCLTVRDLIKLRQAMLYPREKAAIDYSRETARISRVLAGPGS